MKKVKKTRTKLAAVKSLYDLKVKARTDERYQDLAVAAAENIGAFDKGYWENKEVSKEKLSDLAIDALQKYVMSLIGEYGSSEERAEKTIIDEVNFVRDLI